MAESIHPRVLAVIVGLMVAVMLLLAVLFGQLSVWSAGAGEVSHDPMHSIHISSASYGLNCTPSNPPNSTDALSSQTQPVTAQENNALTQVTALCDTRYTCQFNVTAAGVGFDPAPECDKDISVNYRCFSYDVIHNISAHAGETLQIDCSANTPAQP